MPSPGDSGPLGQPVPCRAVDALLPRSHYQVDWVQKAVQVKQREVQAAERGKRVALAEAEVCKPGGIVTGDRLVKCARMSQKVPMAVRAVAEAEADLQPALEKFEEALDTINRRCLEVR